ncbi:MAG TPA: ABC transporter permease [Pyrinomonadaceae bacterium]|jgi:ABC-type dipeptide/oligopeptide/nickel transport system permease subunit|nr:ABC transporter permease [Pyrinomonadaceae bacterium]
MVIEPTALNKILISPRSNGFRRSWRRFAGNKIAVCALCLIVFQIIIAVAAPYIAPYNPYKGDFLATWETPNRLHWLGTDDLGRDVLSRLLYGARISLSVGILSQLAIALVGVPLGALAGLKGGWIDYVLMRAIDILSSLPTILFYILLMIALGAGFWNLILAMTLTGWIGIARLVRGQVLSLKKMDYIRASRAMGASTFYILKKHILRNVMSPIIVSVALGVPAAMFAEAGLSFLGLGVPAPEISWGQMIGMYQPYIRTAWHLTFFPAIILALTMLVWFLLADGVRNLLDIEN